VDGGTDAGPVGQPPPPSGPTTTSIATHNFAIRNLYLGDTDPTPTFTTDTNAWQSFGYNLDGVVTTAASTDVCLPYSSQQLMQQVDGLNGIDNAFGSVLVSQLSAFGAAFGSQGASMSIASGDFTLELDTKGLNGAATQTATGLSGQYFLGAEYSDTNPVSPPPVGATGFAINDTWPVNSSSLNSTSFASGAALGWGGSYVTAGTWVSGALGGGEGGAPLVLGVVFSGHPVVLRIHAAVVTFPVSKDTTGQLHTTGGTIAGVLVTSEVVQAFNQLAAEIGICEATGQFDALIEGASDILIGGADHVSNGTGASCNAISIGIEFDADEIAPPTGVGNVVDAGNTSCDAAQDATAPITDAGSSDVTSG
jgi:hypothetical protein